MKPLLERLAEGKTLVADGALGTMLFQRGVDSGQCPESVNLTRPEILEEIARLYLEAGSDLIEANTFGASSLKLAAYGLADRADEIIRSAVAAIRRAVGGRAYVYASCGPTGKLLKPHGDTDPDAIRASFRRQVGVLIEENVDAICVETMTDLTEATLAVRAVKEISPSTPVLATMTFDTTPRGFFTIMGVSIVKAAAGLRDAGADVIGSNCGNGTANMIEIARQFRRCTDLPLLIQPNAGLPQMKAGRPVYPETPAFMAEKAKDLLAIGVAIIGGCCGTTPEHIRAIRAVVDSRS